ncbi:hypothetical protein [Curtobacterium sp. PhB115]|uniref:hypothetical protein n=1 Tax=Curtobacterium sp. PhB115 TaxID=2485173 RepID=UPI000F4CA90E|nr:hypothetical protein [Curtobacterium sp. PhB115]ROP74420.1 hypothetical protein EDF19_0504 [Curtobacterium sp. PhB115]
MANTANTANTQTPAPKAESFDRSSVTRTFARLKHEVGGLVDDAGRTRPFYAASKEEAIAKRDAALKVLDELAQRIDTLKKEGN